MAGMLRMDGEMTGTHTELIQRRRGGATWVALLAAGVSAVAVLGGCGSDTAPSRDPEAHLLGGDTTVFDQSRNAFSLSARNLPEDRRDRFFVGNALFNRTWVHAPASTSGIDGLGPTFNANSCSACHFKDGRGAPPEKEGQGFLGLLLRLSVPGEDDHGGPAAEPNYGGQFNPLSILGVPSEGKATVSYEEVEGAYEDGTAFTLLQPTYQFAELAFGPLADDVMISPRVAPVMVGLGLLEAVSEEAILAMADPDDENGDGISGRPNYVWDPKAKREALGRFGWKANQPGLEQQNAGAMLGDIGITSPLDPEENCPAPQTECAEAPNGGEPEIDQDKLEDITHYTALLAVPVRRDMEDEQARRGEVLFGDLGCAGCHTPKLATGTLEAFPEVSNQTIRPFTDLLLHDMGEGLSDERPDFLATGREWRTPPLWGIGLVQTVNRHTRFLHDGRARNLTEAVLWHGGEAEAARDAFAALDGDDRAALIRFLNSL
jgi:CxxC motif-containing protein (DUF1111 family)